MTLAEIMRDREELFDGKWFKRKTKPYAVRWNHLKDRFEYKLGKEIKEFCFQFDLDDFLADDWEWLKEV